MATKSEEKGYTMAIGGVPISFPFPSAYTSQKQLMAKVMMALKRGQNALLEVNEIFGENSNCIPCIDITQTNKQSPTGSGKSLAILCSVLAWHKFTHSSVHINTNKPSTESDFKSSKPPPKIIFTSRTHGQLQQLIAEFRRTAYADHFQMVVLGSRKSLCINQKIQPLSDRNDQWFVIPKYHRMHSFVYFVSM